MVYGQEKEEDKYPVLRLPVPFHWCLCCACEVNGTGIVDQNVDAPKPVYGLVDGILQL